MYSVNLLGGGDALLHAAHVGGEGGLVADGGGNTTQQGGYLRTSLKNKTIVNTKNIRKNRVIFFRSRHPPQTPF